MPANKDKKQDMLPLYQPLATIVNKLIDKKLDAGAMLLTDNRESGWQDSKLNSKQH
jgi:hypothetical protein